MKILEAPMASEALRGSGIPQDWLWMERGMFIWRIVEITPFAK
jgi:hypothetical protein